MDGFESVDVRRESPMHTENSSIDECSYWHPIEDVHKVSPSLERKNENRRVGKNTNHFSEWRILLITFIIESIGRGCIAIFVISSKEEHLEKAFTVFES